MHHRLRPVALMTRQGVFYPLVEPHRAVINHPSLLVCKGDQWLLRAQVLIVDTTMLGPAVSGVLTFLPHVLIHFSDLCQRLVGVGLEVLSELGA